MKSEKVYRRLAYIMLWSVVTFTSLLTYIAEIRPFFVTLLGVYFAGVFDGIIGTILFLVIVFYLASRDINK